MAEEFDFRTQQQEIYRYVASRIARLQAMYLSDGRQGQAAKHLAILRRSAGKEPGSTPEVWAIEFDGCPEILIGKGKKPSYGELAIHTALTLYATHQQSQQQPMHVAGKEHNFGSAVRVYVYKTREGETLESGELPRRFAAMVTSESFDELSHYARQLVKLLRSQEIPLDYGLLAQQLLLFQIPSMRNQVLLEWGRGYARSISSEPENDTDITEKRKEENN